MKSSNNKLYYGLVLLFLIGQSFINGNTSAEPIKFTELTVFTGHTDIVLIVAWSPDGSKLASGSYDHSIKIWDVKTGENINTLLGHTDRVTALAWNPNGKELASGSWDGNITIWNTETWKKNMMFELHGNHVNILAWNPNGTILASGNEDGTIVLFDTRSNSTLRIINETETVKYIAWSHNGTQLASVPGFAWQYYGAGYLRFWDVASGQKLKEYGTQGGPLAWSPNETEFAQAITNSLFFNNIAQWDSGIGGYDFERAIFEKLPLTFISSIIYSPDGGKVALLSSDSTNITLLNVTTGERETLFGQGHHVKTVAWSPDGKMLASGSDNDIIIWKDTWKKPVTDVHLDSIKVDKGNVIIGDSINITVALRNNGTADGLNIKVELFDGSTYLNTNYLDVLSGHFNGFKFLWRTNNSTPLGSHNFRAIFGLEEKNVTVLVNAIPRPNVYVMNMTVGESNITVGKSTVITAIIANNGTADATNVNVSFYVDKAHLKTMRENITKDGVVTTNVEWTTKNTTVGDHVLKVVVGNSSKQTTVHVKKQPAIILNYSISTWLIGLIILLIIIISLIFGYDAYKKGLNK